MLANNAGWSDRNQSLLSVREAEFERVFAVNVKSIFHVSRAVVPVMRRQAAADASYFGSTGGIRPPPGIAGYNGSKAAVNAMSRSMAVELAPDKSASTASRRSSARRGCSKPSWAPLIPRKIAQKP
jgi:3-oxoacyl-[acyl-carrier protein] reductase